MNVSAARLFRLMVVLGLLMEGGANTGAYGTDAASEPRTAPAHAEETTQHPQERAALEIDPAIYSVATGGCWSRDAVEGVYRLLIYRGGFEELYHHVYVQLIQTNFQEHDFRVLTTIPIAETQGIDLVFQDLHRLPDQGECGDVVYESTVLRRTANEQRAEHFRLRVTPAGTYAVSFTPLKAAHQGAAAKSRRRTQ